jgi:ubiquinol-cytochrome c reductase iron-sulfur subunit
MKRTERLAVGCLAASIVAALGLFVVYVRGGQPQLEGVLLAVTLGGIAAALLTWSTSLMPRIHDETQARHSGATTDADLTTVAETVGAGMDELARRRFLSRLVLGAIGALGLAALIPIRSLGRAPKAALDRTEWTAGAKLVGIDGKPLSVDTLEIGSFTTVFPEGLEGSADSQAVLIHVDAGQLQLPPDREGDSVEGLVAYSKICTHAGCPLDLYLEATHELRCPCHQSTFNVLDGGTPVYGPAPKPLPQLPIETNAGGELVAKGDFTSPVGPSYWNEPGSSA